MQPSSSRLVIRVILFLLLTIVLVPPYLVFLPFWHRPARALSRIWFACVCRILGLAVEVTGAVADRHPVLFVSNHVSYVDIPVLAMLIDGVFVAKMEVADWPVFGFLAKIGRTVFIQRTAVHAARQRARLARQIETDNLILFPEGTSGDGLTVLPFKSALFSVAKHGPGPTGIAVQPISIAYVADRDGNPLVDGRQDFYAWHGDMTLAPHLKRVLSLPGAKVRVIFHPAIDAEAVDTRKDLAKVCEQTIAEGVAAAHRQLAAPVAA